MIFQSGASSGVSTGVAYTFGVGPTVARGTSTSLTNLAAMAAPPIRPNDSSGGMIVLAILGGVSLLAAIGNTEIVLFLLGVPMLVGGGIGTYYVKQSFSQKLEVWQSKIQQWESTWQCLQCGTRFTRS